MDALHVSRPPRGHAWIRGLLAIGVFCLLLGIYLRRQATTPPPTPVLVLYGYSAVRDAMEDGVVPAFRAAWQREHGTPVEVAATYTGSGDLTRLVLDKIPAHVAILASEVDARRLAPRIVPPNGWKRSPYGGVLVRTPMVLLVRPGNPRGIHGYADLARPDVRVLHPDPSTSGAGAWTVLAAWASAKRDGLDPTERLSGLWANVTAVASSAREARRRFAAGDGDVLPAYEQDALETNATAVVRPAPLLVAEPIALEIPPSMSVEMRPVVEAFLAFLWSREAQAIFVRHGYHSVLPDLPAPTGAVPLDGAWTLGNLGGAEDAERDVLRPVLEGLVRPQVQRLSAPAD